MMDTEKRLDDLAVLLLAGPGTRLHAGTALRIIDTIRPLGDTTAATVEAAGRQLGLSDAERTVAVQAEAALRSNLADTLRAAWRATGFNVAVQGTPGYPKTLLAALGHGAPAVIWTSIPSDGTGLTHQRKVLARAHRGIGGVGALAENIPPDETGPTLNWAHAVGREAASTGVPILSGNATGCDQAFQDGALDADGDVIAYLYSATHQTPFDRSGHPDAIASGRLTLAMAWDPTDRTTRRSPLDRNGLMYCGAACIGAYVTTYGTGERGGTFRGMVDARERDLCHLAIRHGRHRGRTIEGRYGRRGGRREAGAELTARLRGIERTDRTVVDVAHDADPANVVHALLALGDSAAPKRT